MKTRSNSDAAKVAPTATCSAVRWVIIGVHGLYVGQWMRRKDAISAHVKALFIIPSPNYPTEKDAWEECKAKGDRVTKATISWQNDQ